MRGIRGDHAGQPVSARRLSFGDTFPLQSMQIIKILARAAEDRSAKCEMRGPRSPATPSNNTYIPITSDMQRLKAYYAVIVVLCLHTV